MNTVERRAKTERLRKKLKDAGIGKHRNFVVMNCTACGTEHRIRTNHKELYTEDVRRKFVCMLCKK